jgi:hypothetical protein
MSAMERILSPRATQADSPSSVRSDEQRQETSFFGLNQNSNPMRGTFEQASKFQFSRYHILNAILKPLETQPQSKRVFSGPNTLTASTIDYLLTPHACYNP